MGRVWTCTGLRWGERGPELCWAGGGRSALTWGKRVAFAVAEGGGRTCGGARGHPCPLRAPVPGRSTGGRCEECARLGHELAVGGLGLAPEDAFALVTAMPMRRLLRYPGTERSAAQLRPLIGLANNPVARWFAALFQRRR